MLAGGKKEKREGRNLREDNFGGPNKEENRRERLEKGGGKKKVKDTKDETPGSQNGQATDRKEVAKSGKRNFNAKITINLPRSDIMTSCSCLSFVQL